MKTKDPRAAQVLRFWFGETPGAREPRWFEKSAAFDGEIRARFLPLYEEGATAGLAHWKDAPSECLALVIVLDQFPRNMFRGTARAFAADPHALAAARLAVARGYECAMRAAGRMFLYLPFEHSESLEDQLRCCELMKGLKRFPETADAHEWALKHLEIIRRFGRFPHRNTVLGRENTAAEIEFLKEPGSSF